MNFISLRHKDIRSYNDLCSRGRGTCIFPLSTGERDARNALYEGCNSKGRRRLRHVNWQCAFMSVPQLRISLSNSFPADQWGRKSNPNASRGLQTIIWSLYVNLQVCYSRTDIGS